MEGHPAYLIIQQLSPREKAYFKQFAFKKNSKQNDSYKRLLDLLVKMDQYDIEVLKCDKKLESTFKKNIHASLNNLYHKILASTLDFRKNQIRVEALDHLEEFRLLENLNLTSLAFKALQKAEEAAFKGNQYYLIPYVQSHYSQLLRDSAAVDIQFIDNRIRDMDTSVDKLTTSHRINKIAHQIAKLMQINGGQVIRDVNSQLEIQELKQNTLELLPKATSDFWMESVLYSNLLILELISIQLENIDKITAFYLTKFESKITELEGLMPVLNAVMGLKNLLVYSIYLNLEETENLLALFGRLSNILDSAQVVQEINIRFTQLQLLNLAMNQSTFDETLLAQGNHFFEEHVNKQSTHMISFAVVLLIVYVQKKQWNKAIEIIEAIHQQHLNFRVQDEYISIRLIEAIVWYHLENQELHESVLRSVYRNIRKHNGFTLSKEILLSLKKVNRKRYQLDAWLSAVKQMFIKVQKNGSGTEKMRARELEVIASLVIV